MFLFLLFSFSFFFLSLWWIYNKVITKCTLSIIIDFYKTHAEICSEYYFKWNMYMETGWVKEYLWNVYSGFKIIIHILDVDEQHQEYRKAMSRISIFKYIIYTLYVYIYISKYINPKWLIYGDAYAVDVYTKCIVDINVVRRKYNIYTEIYRNWYLHLLFFITKRKNFIQYFISIS